MEIREGKNREKKPLVEFDSTNNSAHQSGLLVSNSEKINSREESKRRCMTERVLGSVDSTTRILSMDFDVADNSAHLVRPYQSGPVVSLLGNENRGEASKRECITKRILGLEDLQQNSGGRRDNAAKSFVGIHTTHSLAQNSFEVVEALPTRKQPNDSVPLLSLGRLTLEGCVQEEKSQDLPRLMQIDGVEQRVTKSPRYLEGFTAQKWATRKGHSLGEKRPYEVSSLPMDLPRSLKLDCSGGLGAQSTVGLPDGGYVLSVLEKKIVGKTLKRKCKTISLFSLEDDQQHGVKRWGDAAKSLGRKRICRQLVVQHVSRAKRIHRQHVFHWWLFQQSATGSPYGGHIQSLLMKEIVRETLKRKCRTSKWKDAVKNLGAKRIGRQLVIHRVSSRKHIIRPLAIHRLPFQQNWATLKVHCLGDERPVDHSQNERSRDQPEGCEGKIKNSTIEDLRPLVVFKRDYAVNQPEGHRIFSIDLQDLRQLISLRSADAVKELEVLRMGRQLVIHGVSSLRLIIRPHAIHQLPFQQNWATLKYFLGDEKPVDHSQNGRTRDQPEGRNWEIKNLLTIEDLQPLVGLKRADAAKQLDAMLICRPLVIHPLSQWLKMWPHVIHRLPFQQNWATLKWYFSIDERRVDLISLCMERKLVSRLQVIHIRIGRCLPQSPALPPSGEIVEPPRALLSSQLPFISNRTQLGGQDRSGSTASPSHNERTRDRPEGSKGKIRNLTIENLRSLGHLKRAEAAEVLGVSPATFKRHCRYLGIKEWPILPPKEVIIPPDQNGERNPSPMFITLSNNGQITTENEMAGQNLDQNTIHDSHRGHCGDVDIPFSAVYNEAEVAAGSGHCGDEHLPDSLEGPNFQIIGNGSIAEVENHNTNHDSHHGHCGDANTGTGSVAEFENHNTIHDSHHGHCGDADVPFSAVQNQTEVAGGLDYFCEEVFESSNFAFPVYSDAAAPSQPVPSILPTMPHSQIASTQILGENMESFEDWRNLLATQRENFPEGHVSGSVNYTISLSQPMSTTPHSTESPEYLRYALASVVEHRMETNHYGSSNLIDPSFFDLAPSLPMQPAIPHMTSVLTERQHSTFVKLNATYGEDTIKLRLPLTSGITELKQVVSKQLELGLDSFKVMYKDEYGEWIKITLDEEVREHLQLTLLGNQVSKLWVVNKVPNTTDFCCNCECDKCRSFKGNRP